MASLEVVLLLADIMYPQKKLHLNEQIVYSLFLPEGRNTFNTAKG